MTDNTMTNEQVYFAIYIPMIFNGRWLFWECFT